MSEMMYVGDLVRWRLFGERQNTYKHIGVVIFDHNERKFDIRGPLVKEFKFVDVYWYHLHNIERTPMYLLKKYDETQES